MVWFRSLRTDAGRRGNAGAPTSAGTSGSTSTGAASSTPLADVKAAMQAGMVSRAEIAAATGLSRITVDAALEHLQRTGAVRSERLSASCPSGGCGNCSHATAEGNACGPASPGGQRGPVVLTLAPTQRTSQR